MAISYGLEIATLLKPQQALELMAAHQDLSWQDHSLRGEGIQIHASYLDDSDQLLTEEDFGFRPTLEVNFRLNPSQYDTAMKALCDANLALLTQETGDAVLLFNYETVVLQRINGHLTFNSEEMTPALTPLVEHLTRPDEMRSLA